MNKTYLNLTSITLTAILLFIALPTQAQTITYKTPTDVFRLTLILADQLQTIQKDRNSQYHLPEIPPQTGKDPGHVLQKAIEILNKINRLRQIKGMGPIAILPYPARHITNNDVYQMVSRLVSEVRLLSEHHTQPTLTAHTPTNLVAKTSNDVYQKLWSISHAMDPMLGVRGFSPSDVYAQSMHILELVRFLRLTQNIGQKVAKPPLPTGKHSNHALQAAYKLLAKIAKIESNLWIKPTETPKVPHRVITPTEVYDALQHVIAELQRIKYRLGVERYLPTPAVEVGKSPNDVIQNLEWATAMLPTFSLKQPLQQHDQESLQKTADDLNEATEHIISELLHYKALRGIRSQPRIPPAPINIQPKHLYQKTLETLEKVSLLRIQGSLGAMTVLSYPLRPITSTEVYELVVGLDTELAILYEQANMSNTETIFTTLRAAISTGETASHVYKNVWYISNILDTLLGTAGFTDDDIYQQTTQILAESEIISRHLDRWPADEKTSFHPGYGPRDILNKTEDIMTLLENIQRRAGLYYTHPPQPPLEQNVTNITIFNAISSLKMELLNLKIHLGITTSAATQHFNKNKTASHTYQLLIETHNILSNLMEDR